jgi:phospholipid/cholesterol/gamma-HCH transport system substrate-binding protein
VSDVRRLPVIAVVLTGMLLSSCSIVGGGGGGNYQLTAWFPKTIALVPASDVKVLGLSAGKVKDVKVDQGRVRVVLNIKKSIPVPADVHAEIVPQSLIGERYVQLFPAWTNGQALARNGDVIPEDRTAVPVEPDEALAALKKFLDSLDPNATGRLVQNAANDLSGNGQNLNDAVANLGQLVGTLADKDTQLGDIIDNFDRFTVTLSSRESQLGHVMDTFANLASLLAEERTAIETTVKNLGSVSTDAFDLLSENRAGIDKDLTQLTRVLQAVKANIGSVQQVLDTGPLLVNGLHNAYSPTFHRIDLRTQLSPTVGQVLLNIFGDQLAVVCLPIDVSCTPTQPPVIGAGAKRAAAGAPPVTPPAASPPAGPPIGAVPAVPGLPAPAPATTSTTAPNPLDSLLQLFGSGGAHVGAVGAAPAEQAAHASGGIASFFRDAAHALVGVIS